MNQQEIINAIALTRIGYFSLANILQLYRAVGSATEIVNHRSNIRDILPTASDRLVASLKDIDEPLRRAEAELEFDERHHITPLLLSSPDYPERLRHCDDAPLVLYYRGTADLNAPRVINIVGTRQATSYGQELTRRLVADLRQLAPDVVIVSGLAYGIDICAHRNAMQQGYDTVGVLAHGLDQIYPSAHRSTAADMVKHGGLLTEYMSQTEPLPNNFRQRNRIVAGISDATILVESAIKGGGLITCRIAQEYGRDVFAFPGAVGMATSEGCNRMIRNNTAALITSAKDFLESMGWQTANQRTETVERQLFPDLSAEERCVADVLRQKNDLQLNLISIRTNLPIGQLTALLFSLEMKGIVKPMAGGTYHLIS